MINCIFAQVSLSDGQSELTQNTFIAFGGLTNNTLYTANVTAVDENGTLYEVDQTAEIDFITCKKMKQLLWLFSYWF